MFKPLTHFCQEYFILLLKLEAIYQQVSYFHFPSLVFYNRYEQQQPPPTGKITKTKQKDVMHQASTNICQLPHHWTTASKYFLTAFRGNQRSVICTILCVTVKTALYSFLYFPFSCIFPFVMCFVSSELITW